MSKSQSATIRDLEQHIASMENRIENLEWIIYKNVRYIDAMGMEQGYRDLFDAIVDKHLGGSQRRDYVPDPPSQPTPPADAKDRT